MKNEEFRMKNEEWRSDARGNSGPRSQFFILHSKFFIHLLLTANAKSAPPKITPAAPAAANHAGFSAVIGTSGFAGRLYCAGSPRTRKKAWVPPTLVSFGFQIVASVMPAA